MKKNIYQQPISTALLIIPASLLMESPVHGGNQMGGGNDAAPARKLYL